MKMDVKFFIFIVAAVIVAIIIMHFVKTEKHTLDGKVHKGLFSTPSVPAVTDPANPANPGSPFNPGTGSGQ
jgi:hypothetical protein